MQIIDKIIVFFNNTAWLQALLVGLLAYGLAKLISHFVPKGLHKLSDWLKFPVGEKLIELFPTPIFYTIFMLGLSFAAGLLGLSDGLEFTVLASLRSVLIVVLALFALRLTKLLLQMASDNPKAFTIIQPQTLPLFSNLAVFVFILSTVYIIFATWDVDMSALLASAGIVGLAVGMAAKDTLSDVISGVLILTDSPYRVGDIIILEDGTRGRVANIGIRSTRIQTVENFDVMVPNSNIGNSKIINESSNPSESRMIAIDVQFAYGTDMNQVAEALTNLGKQHPSVLEKPAPAMKVIELNRERVHCRLLSWIGPEDNRYFIEFALNEMIYKHFAEMNIPIFKPRENTLYVQEFPEQAQEIHIKEMPSVFGKPSLGSSTATSGGALPKMPASSARDRVDELLKNKIRQPASTRATGTAKPSSPPVKATRSRAHPAKPVTTQKSPASQPPIEKKPAPAKPVDGPMKRDDEGNNSDMMIDMDGAGE